MDDPQLNGALMVGLGSAVGGLLRRFLIGIEELLGSWLQIDLQRSTLAANMLGSFGIGLVAAYPTTVLDQQLRLFLGAGICGGFTALSSFSVETMLLLRRGERGLALLNVIASCVCGFAAAAAGLALGQVMAGA